MIPTIQQKIDHCIVCFKTHPKTAALAVLTGFIALRAIPDVIGTIRDWNKPSLEQALFSLISVKNGMNEARLADAIVTKAKLSITWRYGLSITAEGYRGSCQIDPIGLRLSGIGDKLSHRFRLVINPNRENELEEFDAWRPIALKIVELHEESKKRAHKIGPWHFHKFVIGEIIGFFSERGGSHRLLSKPFDPRYLGECFSDNVRIRGVSTNDTNQ